MDTNIFIDLLANRKPFSKFAIEIFDKGEKGKVSLFTSTHVIVTTHYLLKKFIEERRLREDLLYLLSFVNLIPVDGEIIKRGLKSKHKDFEDAVQILCAHRVNDIDFIATRDARDYKDSGINALAPDDLIKKI